MKSCQSNFDLRSPGSYLVRSYLITTVIIYFQILGEACSLCNLGNCHSSRNEFVQAVPFYENYLMLSQELNDIEGEAKACHFLGYAF